MDLDLRSLKAKEPINERLSIPVGRHMRDRYFRLKRRLETKDLRKLHDLTREMLSKMMDDIDRVLKDEGDLPAA